MKCWLLTMTTLPRDCLKNNTSCKDHSSNHK